MEQTTVQPLNQAVIHSTFLDDKGRTGTENAIRILNSILLILGILFGISGEFVLQIIGILLVLLIPLLLAVGKKYASVAADIQSKEYYICEKTCVSKEIVTDADSDSVLKYRYLYMDPYCRVELSFPYARGQQIDLYETAEPGDRFYLLCSKKDQVLYLYNRKHWMLDERDFIRTDEDFYIPA